VDLEIQPAQPHALRPLDKPAPKIHRDSASCKIKGTFGDETKSRTY
jgi:hypothetical protein